MIDTLHPIYEGRGFAGGPPDGKTTCIEYGRTYEGEAAEGWRGQPVLSAVAIRGVDAAPARRCAGRGGISHS